MRRESAVQRIWWPLQAALAFSITRDRSFAAEVGSSELACRAIRLDLDIRLAQRELAKTASTVKESSSESTPVNADEAWRWLASLVADERVTIRALAMDRYRDGRSFIEREYQPSDALPPATAEHLVLWDAPPDGETWLAPSNHILLGGQGRFYKKAMVHGPSVMLATQEPGEAVSLLATKDPVTELDLSHEAWQCLPLEEAIRRARPIVFPKGVPAGLKVYQRNFQIEQYLESKGVSHPGPRTFQRAFSKAATR
jgi:hypothetical protein